MHVAYVGPRSTVCISWIESRKLVTAIGGVWRGAENGYQFTRADLLSDGSWTLSGRLYRENQNFDEIESFEETSDFLMVYVSEHSTSLRPRAPDARVRAQSGSDARVCRVLRTRYVRCVFRQQSTA